MERLCGYALAFLPVGQAKLLAYNPENEILRWEGEVAPVVECLGRLEKCSEFCLRSAGGEAQRAKARG